jgi:hypothetical protein
MLISAKDAPQLFLCLRVWDTSDELVPILTWFNTDTMIASCPGPVKCVEERASVGRFEFIVQSESEASHLKGFFPKGEEHLVEHIQVVLEE